MSREEWFVLIFVLGVFIYYTWSPQLTKKLSGGESSEYRKRGFGSAQITRRGELVKSKGERRIADFLLQQGITYKYEVYISGMSADFFLPKFKLYIEYWGMVDVAGLPGKQYRASMRLKLARYQAMKLKLFSILPADLNNLHEKILPAL